MKWHIIGKVTQWFKVNLDLALKSRDDGEYKPRDDEKSTVDSEIVSGIPVDKKPPIDRLSFWGVLIIVIFIGGFLIWAFVAKIESAAIAPGKIIVAGNHRVIQHLEGGIVSAIYVKDGVFVKKGQLLLKIDDTQSSIRFQSEHGKVLRLLANEARLRSLIQGKKTITFPSSLINGVHDPEIKKLIESQKASFTAERQKAEGHLDILNQRILQLQQQIAGVQAQLNSSVKQLNLIKEELSAMLILAKEQLVDRGRVLSLQREEQKLLGLRGEYQASVAHLNQKIGETRLAIIVEKNKLDTEWNKQLHDIRDKLAFAKDRKRSAQDVFKRTDVIAPISGVVLNSKLTAVGNVVKPGEAILEIVPQHEELLVEAKVNPLDIDVVHKGLTAKVVLSALKTRTTPTLLGTVIYVSADSKLDKATKKNYYSARIRIHKKELDKMTKDVLHPGMPVEVMIITNRLTPWEYFVDPVERSFRRAFRD